MSDRFVGKTLPQQRVTKASMGIRVIRFELETFLPVRDCFVDAAICKKHASKESHCYASRKPERMLPRRAQRLLLPRLRQHTVLWPRALRARQQRAKLQPKTVRYAEGKCSDRHGLAPPPERGQ